MKFDVNTDKIMSLALKTAATENTFTVEDFLLATTGFIMIY